jgi:hypothetical protein
VANNFIDQGGEDNARAEIDIFYNLNVPVQRRRAAPSAHSR